MIREFLFLVCFLFSYFVHHLFNGFVGYMEIFRRFCKIVDAKIGVCLLERKQRSYLGLLLNSAPVAWLLSLLRKSHWLGNNDAMPHKMNVNFLQLLLTLLTLKTLIYSIDRWSNLDLATAAAEMGDEGKYEVYRRRSFWRDFQHSNGLPTKKLKACICWFFHQNLWNVQYVFTVLITTYKGYKLSVFGWTTIFNKKCFLSLWELLMKELVVTFGCPVTEEGPLLSYESDNNPD